MRTVVFMIFIGVICSLFSGVESTHAAGFEDSYISVTVLQNTTVYVQPSIGSSVVAAVKQGEQFTVLRSSRYYHYISLPDGRFGWVRKKHSSTRTIPFQTADSLMVGSVRQTSTPVFSGPGTGYKTVASLKKGEEYPVLKASIYYYKIQMPAGRTGWISKTKVRLTGKARLVAGWNYWGTTDTFIRQSGAASSWMS